MLVHFPTLSKTRKQAGATALRGIQGQLVEGEDFDPSLEDAAPGMAVHRKCIHLQFGTSKTSKSLVTVHTTNHRGFAILARKFQLLDYPGKGLRWPVGTTHEQPLQHHLV